MPRWVKVFGIVVLVLALLVVVIMATVATCRRAATVATPRP
jgi:Na+-transporting methylmalonyl-CoA/oxaloacetate decarboxylase gamma subunit